MEKGKIDSSGDMAVSSEKVGVQHTAQNDKQLRAETWVREYGDRLLSFAVFRVKNKQVAEDLVQETFLAGFRAYDRFEERSSVYTWLVSILKNKIIDHYRKNSRVTEVDLGFDQQDPAFNLFDKHGLWKDSFDDWSVDPERLLSEKQFFIELQACIEDLPDNLRKAFVLKVVDKLETKEICEILDITPNNLWVLLHRARLKLRKSLDDRWFKKVKREK